MSTKQITVPCDFGVENLHDEFHGNVEVEFADSSKMRVSSLILSWNSEVFKELFTEMRQRNIELKDFSKQTVILFLEGLYSGDIQFKKSQFREMNKLSHAFKVKWLSEKCLKFFTQLFETELQDFPDLCFLFNEAMYSESVLKSSNFMETVVERFSNFENISEVFVEHYLKENYSSIKPAPLDHLLTISRKQYTPILRVLHEHLKEEGDILCDTTRTILSNNEVVQGFAEDTDLYDDVFELLLTKFDNSTADDMRLLKNLSKYVIEAVKNRTDNIASSSGVDKVVPVKIIANLYHTWELVNDTLTVMPDISIFMKIEQIYWCDDSTSRGKMLETISERCTSRSLCRVPRVFVDSFWASTRLKGLPQSVVSNDDTVVIIGTQTTLEDLVTTEKFYKFVFKHPAAPQCNNHTQCGFLLKVTPPSMDGLDEFNIELITDDDEYPGDLHCHKDVISGTHIHLVVEEYWDDWVNSCNFLCWKPWYTDRCDLEWGDTKCDTKPARFVVYYDVRQCNTQ